MPAAPAVPAARTNGQIEKAVVHVATAWQDGAGFLASGSRILTSASIVDAVKNVLVHFWSGSSSLGTVAATDRALDLAVVEVANLPVDVCTLDWERAPQPGLAEPVWTWEVALERDPAHKQFRAVVSVARGVVAARPARDGVAYLQLDADRGWPLEGGPVTTPEGLVVGLAAASSLGGAGEDGQSRWAIDLTQHREQIRSLLGAPSPRLGGALENSENLRERP